MGDTGTRKKHTTRLHFLRPLSLRQPRTRPSDWYKIKSCVLPKKCLGKGSSLRSSSSFFSFPIYQTINAAAVCLSLENLLPSLVALKWNRNLESKVNKTPSKNTTKQWDKLKRWRMILWWWWINRDSQPSFLCIRPRKWLVQCGRSYRLKVDHLYQF